MNSSSSGPSAAIENISENNSTLSPQKPSRSEILNQKIIMKKLEDLLGLEYVKQISATKTPLIIINRARIRDVCMFLLDHKYQLESMTVSEGDQFFELNLIFHNYPIINNSTLIIQSQIDKSVELLSIIDIYPNAAYLEYNLTNRFGIKFKSVKKIDENISIRKPGVICTPISFKIPHISKNPNLFGIFHPIHNSHYYLTAQTKNSIINTVELRDGWLYKRIQPQLENCNPLSDYNRIFQQISSRSIVHLQLATFFNLEFALSRKPSNKANYLRTLFAELERVRSHMLWFINLADLLGHNADAIKIFKNYKKLANIIERYFLNESLINATKFSGSMDIEPKSARIFWKFIKSECNCIFDSIYDLVYKNSTHKKCEFIGAVSKENALKFGLTGPSLRGSDQTIDLRASNPYLIYTSGELSQHWNIISFKQGDVFARTQVRLWEIRESLEIIKFILENLAIYQRKLKVEPIPENPNFEPNQNLFTQVESPGGILGVLLKSDFKTTQLKLPSVKLITPDLANFAALNQILPGEDIKNVPLIVHSLDLDFHMIDL